MASRFRRIEIDLFAVEMRNSGMFLFFTFAAFEEVLSGESLRLASFFQGLAAVILPMQMASKSIGTSVIQDPPIHTVSPRAFGARIVGLEDL